MLLEKTVVTSISNVPLFIMLLSDLFLVFQKRFQAIRCFAPAAAVQGAGILGVLYATFVLHKSIYATYSFILVGVSFFVLIATCRRKKLI